MSSHAYREGPYKYKPTKPKAPKQAGTRFPKSVRGVKAPLLKTGANNKKLGGLVKKGIWKDMPLFQLTLEERATCPRVCEQWDNCYGNHMPFAVRTNHEDPAFFGQLKTEVEELSKKYPKGFVVRLHVLGDFFSEAYVIHWRLLLQDNPPLHVFGYTHRRKGNAIHQRIKETRAAFPNRFLIRQSDERQVFFSANVVSKNYRPKPKEIICPEQLGKTKSCCTCGLCWTATDKRILFLEH